MNDREFLESLVDGLNGDTKWRLLSIIDSYDNNGVPKEVTRIKEGNFTEEEFQNFCHNYNCDDRKRFEEDCKNYQRKLFGDDQ